MVFNKESFAELLLRAHGNGGRSGPRAFVALAARQMDVYGIGNNGWIPAHGRLSSLPQRCAVGCRHWLADRISVPAGRLAIGAIRSIRTAIRVARSAGLYARQSGI